MGPDHADSEPDSLDHSHTAAGRGYLFTKSQEFVSVDTIFTLKIPTPLQNISARNDLILITFILPITLSFGESQLIYH